MNKVKYIIQILAVIIFWGCTEDEFTGNRGDIQVVAGFATTRTTFVEDNGTIHVTWNTEDAIGLFTDEQSNLQYTAMNAGSETQFSATGDKLKATEEETVYAYYPYSYSENSQRVKLPNIASQEYKENASEQDFIYTSSSVTGNKLSLQFKHLFAFLKITIPMELIADRGENGGLYIRSSKDISCDAYFDLGKEEMTSEKYNDLRYRIPTDEVLGKKEEITCYIAILPQTENAEIKVFQLNNGTINECLLTKHVLSGGFKAGNIYTLYLNENETEVRRQMERDALFAFYKATGGDNWTHNDNWCSDKPVNEWYGVTTNEGFVNELNLANNNLTGQIPAELYQLENLFELDLGTNELAGHIPEEIGNLKQLRVLRIWGNRIGGTIPNSLCNIPNLLHFYCSGNPIGGTLPDSIGKLKNLAELYMEDTNIGGKIPDSFYDLTNLGYFYASYNKGESPNPIKGTISPKIANLTNLRAFEMRDHQLSGTIPSEIGNLKELSSLHLSGNLLSGSIPIGITDLKKLEVLNLSNNQLSGSIPPEIGNMTSLQEISLGSNQLSGAIPSGIGDLQNLKKLHLNVGNLTGSIPSDIGKLEKMEHLSISNNLLSGEIPSQIGRLSNLYWIDLHSNKLVGSLPPEIGKLRNLTYAAFCNNELSGEVPESITQLPCWQYMWWNMVGYNNIRISLREKQIPGPQFNVTDIDGNNIDSQKEYAKNKYTILFQWATPGSCAYSQNFVPTLITLWERYKDSGLNIIGWNPEYVDVGLMRTFIVSNKIPWRNFRSTNDNGFGDNNYFPESLIALPYMVMTINVVDSGGHIVFSSAIDDSNNLSSFITHQFGEENYESTDYSKDGNVTILQKATEGNGIDIVLMGDAFSDRLIADGTYETTMKKAADFLFTEEPFKTYRNLFNVYMVDAVSKNEVYDGETALSTYFGDGTFVGGNNDKCFEYAQKAISDRRIDEAMIVVMINSTRYAGTCHMYSASTTSDYGSGPSISYFPVGNDDMIFEQLLHHEANGHGFSKLADEYAYQDYGAIPTSEIESYQNVTTSYGWYKNVDFTSDPTQVKWSKYLSDSRYSNDGLGVFEGACTYWIGAYRPTDVSIMRYNTDGFNAPSREAIYYRIHKLAYGTPWAFNYEDFVTYDAKNRKASTRSTTWNPAAIKRFRENHCPPVVIRKNWRSAE